MAYIALPPEPWESVCRRIEQTDVPITWRWAALRVDDGSPRFAVLSVTSGEETSTETLEYREIILGRETLRPTDAAQRLRDGVAQDHERHGRLTFTVPRYPVRPRHRTSGDSGAYRTVSGWPEFEVQYDSEPAVVGAQISNVGQLVEPGRPVYPSGSEAVSHFVFGVSPEQRDLNRMGTVLVRLPDRRARIGEVRLRKRRVRAKLDAVCDGLVVRAAWRDTAVAHEWSWKDWQDPAPEIVLPARGIPFQLGLYLTRDGEVVDSREWSGNYGDRPRSDPWEPEQVAQTIRDGESQRVEFKERIEERKTLASVARTVAAFANGDGGVIFFGVTNHGNVIGAEIELRERVDNVVRESAKPSPPYRWRSVRIQRKTVQTLVVASGTDRPYRSNKVVWIRAQATTREAETSEIRDLCSVASQASLRSLSIE